MKLEIKNISKQYGKKTVLQGVSQEFSGGVYGLLGPNGAGKTKRISGSISVQTIICTHVTQW